MHAAPMGDPRHALGRLAEAATERWLRDAGWEILARRCRPEGGGEIDIAALDTTGVLVALEVRARRSPRAGTAAASLDGRRIRRLRRSLAAYAATSGRPHRGLRIDLVTVEPAAGLPGAWRLARIPAIG